jgi:hypothetical protein
MKFSDFRKTIVEFDARIWFCDRIEQIFEMETSRLPETHREQQRDSVLPVVLNRAIELMKEGDWTGLYALLTEFDLDLRRRVNYELTKGSLKQVTVTSELIRRRPDLDLYLYRGNEQDALQLVLQPDDLPLGIIGFRGIQCANGRTITREMLISQSMPINQTNGKWHENFVSPREIAEAEQAEIDATAAARKPQYGRNLDFPNGIRPR